MWLLPAPIEDWTNASPSQVLSYIYTVTVLRYGGDVPSVRRAELAEVVDLAVQNTTNNEGRPPGFAWLQLPGYFVFQIAKDRGATMEPLYPACAYRAAVLAGEWRSRAVGFDLFAAGRDTWNDVLGRVLVKAQDRFIRSGKPTPLWKAVSLSIGPQPLYAMLAPRAIQSRRQVMALTQRELAEKCNVYMGTVSRWESGVLTPSLEHCRSLATILGGDPADYRRRTVV